MEPCFSTANLIRPKYAESWRAYSTLLCFENPFKDNKRCHYFLEIFTPPFLSLICYRLSISFTCYYYQLIKGNWMYIILYTNNILCNWTKILMEVLTLDSQHEPFADRRRHWAYKAQNKNTWINYAQMTRWIAKGEDKRQPIPPLEAMHK